MKRWGLRHRFYRVAFIGVVFCAFLFLIGFSVPAWKNNSKGLWMDCSDGQLRHCVFYSSRLHKGTLPAWFKTVQVFESLGLIFICLSLATEVYTDFLSRPSSDTRMVELFTLFGGVFGLLGAAIFAAFTPVSAVRFAEVYLGWGFALSTAASCLLVALASVVAYFRKKGLDPGRFDRSPIQFHSRDGVVIPEGLGGGDLLPPPYSEVVNQPPTQPGGQPLSDPADFKPWVSADPTPPPAYFPPPASGQFQAPPAYEAAQPSTSAPSSHTASSQSTSVAPDLSHGDCSVGVVNQGLDFSPDLGPDQTRANLQTEDADGQSGTGSGVPDCSVPVPAYYVTVLGQRVPVLEEELLQSGGQTSAASLPVPAYFIVCQGQHVPVYSEEQARAINTD